MKSGTYITIVILAAFGLIGYLFTTTPDTAPTQLPLILAGVGALVAVLNKQGDTDAKVEKSIAVSAENAQTLAAVTVQTSHALDQVSQKQDTTNKLVDGHLSGLTAKIDALMQKVAMLEKDKAVKEVADAHAEASTAQIISAIAAIVPIVGATPLGTPIIEPPHEGRSGPGDSQ